MADDVKAGEDTGAPSPDEVRSDFEKDERGVSWENRAREYERKYGELAQKMEQVEQYLTQKEQESTRSNSPNAEEEAKRLQLQNLASDPEAYVQQRIQAEMYKAEAARAAEWVRSQEGFKPEHEKGILETIQKYSLGGPPMQKAELAWRLFKMDASKTSPNRSKQEESRDKEVRKYQVEGPGRVGPAPKSDARKELLDKLKNAKSRTEKAMLLGQITDQYFKEKGVL
jgi:hypothetical protein